MKKCGAVAVSALAMIGLAGCGTGDSTNRMPRITTGTLGQACTVMTLPVLEFQWPLIAWQAGGVTPEAASMTQQWNPDGLDPMIPSIDDSVPEQVAVEDIALEIKGLASELQDAVDAKDDARAQQVVDATKRPVDEFVARCSAEPDWSSKASVVALRADLDEKPRR